MKLDDGLKNKILHYFTDAIAKTFVANEHHSFVYIQCRPNWSSSSTYRPTS